MSAARILVVDDHPASLELMRYLLAASGYAPITAEDGMEAVAIARSDRPDLIVCDMQLRDLDGFEVARLLRSDPALRDIPLIAVSAFSIVGDRATVLAGGFDDFYFKPIEPESFVAQVEQHLPVQLLSPH